MTHTLVGCLKAMGDYTTQLYGGIQIYDDKPSQGSLSNNQYFMESIYPAVFFFRWKIFASTSQEIQKHLTRQLREEKQEASSWVQGGAKSGEITALKEVITPVSPYKPIYRDYKPMYNW